MSKFDKDVFTQKLSLTNLGYTQLQAQYVSDRLAQVDTDIKNAAMEWLEDGTQPDLAAEGWSVERLEAEFGMNVIAALLTIDWLRKDAAAALAAIKDGIK